MAHQQHLDFPPNPEAERRVADYLDAVIRASAAWQPTYPHEDIEYLFVGALYRAAWTYRPGPASFWRWWNRKAQGSLTGLNRRARRWERGLAYPGRLSAGRREAMRGHPIRMVGYSAEAVDGRYYYREH